jgi:TonB-dependent SusC/RagA subfamily outer membrane receptor
MKYSTTILLPAMFCFLLNNVFGQQIINKKADTLKNIRICCGTNLPGVAPLYIIDEKEIPDSLATSKRLSEKVNPNDIFAISILKDVDANTVYGAKGAHGVVIITTRMYAKAKYQNQLSAFSGKYRKYLKRHQNDDSDFVYLLNGEVLATDKVVTQLYALPPTTIKSVEIMNKYYKNIFNNNKPIIVITTKQ